MQILSTLLLVSALAAGFVDAKPTPTFKHVARHVPTATKTTSKDCGKNEFFWEKRSCCLSSGGPTATPTPPSGIDCPKSWYFHHGEGCCVPRTVPTHTATPTCAGKGWSWLPNLQCCSKGGSPPTSIPTPSGKPKPKSKKDSDSDKLDKKPHDKKDHSKIKRNFEQWDASFCPTGLTACPIRLNNVLTGDSECIDTTSDLTSCGGCASLGKGEDCSLIPNASCLGGVCVA